MQIEKIEIIKCGSAGKIPYPHWQAKVLFDNGSKCQTVQPFKSMFDNEDQLDNLDIVFEYAIKQAKKMIKEYHDRKK